MQGRLDLRAGTGLDQLIFDDSGDTADRSGTLNPGTITGFGMVDAGVTYAGFEEFGMRLGSGRDALHVANTITGTNNIDAGAGDDVVNIERISGETTVVGGSGDDILRANYDRNGLQTHLNGIAALLTLRGGADSDRFDIGLSGTGSARIKVSDTADDGINQLHIYGTDLPDFFLSRPHAMSAVQVDPVTREPVAGGGVERVDYDDSLIGGGMFVYGRGGDDTFVFDDTSMPMTVFGDAGNDTFQIGQVFQSARDATNPFNGLAPEDYFATIQVTQGFLSTGVSFPATMYGGAGNDTFTIYHNSAELFLFGEADDDVFRQRAFVKTNPNDPKRPFTNINGGQGADFIEYAVNEPVNIEGGDGFDTVTVLGTEFGDDFMITKDAIYGAGLPTRFDGIEKVTIDGLEGNDTFFVDSTKDNTAVEIVGGRGSDTFNVAGGSNGQPITVVASANQGGHSGLIDHSIDVQSADNYQGVTVPDLSAIVADNETAGVVITRLDSEMKLIEGALGAAPGSVIAYAVALTRPPEEDVRVHAVVGQGREADRIAGGRGIMVAVSPTGAPLTAQQVLDNGNEDGATLIFNRDNWSVPQTVFIVAPTDSLAEGTRNITIQHTVLQGGDASDGGAYDKLKVASVSVKVVDDDTAQVAVDESGGNTMVFERTGVGASQALAGDQYVLRLTKAPADGTTVKVTVAVQPDDNGVLQVQVKKPTDSTPADSTEVTFDANNWQSGVPITVYANDDTTTEGVHYARITHTLTSSVADFLNVTADDVAQGLTQSVVNALLESAGTGRQSPITADAAGNVVTVSGPVFTADSADAKVVINTQASQKAWMSADVTLSGNVVDQTTWTLTVDGNAYQYQVGVNDTLDTIAQGLGLKISQDYHVTVTGSQLHVSNTSSNAGAASLLAVQDAVAAGQVWTVSVDNGIDKLTTSYTVTAGDLTTWGAGAAAQSAGLAGALAAKINAGVVGYLARADGAELVIVRQDGASFASAYALGNIERAGAAAVSHSFNVTGSPVVEGDQWSLALNDGANSQFAVTTGVAEAGAADPKAALAARLAAEINKDVNNDHLVDGSYVAFADGSRLNVVQRVDGRAFTLNANVTEGGQTFNQLDLRASAVRAGDIWTVRLDAGGTVKTYSVTVDTADAAAVNPKVAIAAKLAEAIIAGGVYDATATGATLSLRHLSNAAFTSDYEASRPFALSATAPSGGTAAVAGTRSADRYQKLVFSVSAPGGATTWSLNINGESAAFTAGANGDSTSIASVDVQIVDNEAPGVIVTQTGYGTNVTEPSDHAVIGTGQITKFPAAGSNSEFKADFGTATMDETDAHDSLATAQNLDFGKWSKNADANIGDATTLPHLTINGTGDNQVDYYKFTVDDTMLGLAGGSVHVAFDIDKGFDNSDPLFWGSKLSLFTEGGGLLAQGLGYSDPSNGFLYPGQAASGQGSTTWLDDYLQYDITAAGTYVVSVDNWLGAYSYWKTGVLNGVPQGVDYQLQVSIEEHRVDGFQFSPTPIIEDEAGNSTTQNFAAQDIDAAGNWYAFFDSTVGNQLTGGGVNSLTPYAKILGGGDGSWDVYQFHVSDAMLHPDLGNVTTTVGTALTGRGGFFEQAGLTASGEQVASTWTLKLDGKTYTYDASAGDTLDKVVSELQKKLPADYSADASGAMLSISLPSGFSLDSDLANAGRALQQEIAVAGQVTKTQRALDQNGAELSFTSAQIKLGGATNATEGWTLYLDGTPVSTSQSDTDAVGSYLAGHLPGGYTGSYDPGLDTLTVNNSNGFTTRVAIATATGASSAATVEISGTPEQDAAANVTQAQPTSVEGVKWTQAQVTFGGTLYQGQKWTLTLTDSQGTVTQDYTVGVKNTPAVNETAADVAANFIAPAGYTFGHNGNVLTITNGAGRQFTAAVSFTQPAADAAQTTSGTASQYSKADITLAGTPHVGETWHVGVTDAQGVRSVYDYLVTDVHGTGAVTLDDVALGLKNKIGASAGNSANVLTINSPLVNGVGGIKVDFPAVTPAATAQGSIAEDTANSQRMTDSRSVNFAGLTVTNGAVWSMTLNGTTRNATVGTTKLADNTTVISTLDQLGTYFVEQFNGSNGFNVTYSGSVLQVANAGNKSAFTMSLTAGAAGSQTVTTSLSSTRWSSLKLDLATGGTNIGPGESWSLTLNGSTKTVVAGTTKLQNNSLIATAGDVATYFKQQFDNNGNDFGFSITNGTTLTITDDNGIAFTASESVTPPAATSSSPTIAGTSTASHWSAADILLSGNPTKGETWHLVLAHPDGTAAEDRTYTVDDANSDGSITLADVAKGFADLVGNAAIATATGSTLHYSDTAGVRVSTLTVTAAPIQATAGIGGKLPAAWTQTVALSGNGSYVGNGDLFSIGLVTPVDISGDAATESAIAYTVSGVPNSGQLSYAATGLDQAVTKGLNVQAAGQVLTISKADGSEVSIDHVSHTRVSAIDPATSTFTPDTDPHYSQVLFTILGTAEINPEDVWSVVINGKQYDYAVDKDADADERTANLVAQGLVTAINKDTGASYQAVLTQTGGNTIRIEDKDGTITGPGQTITFRSSLGGNLVKGLFDIDGGTVNTVIDSFFGLFSYRDTPLLILTDAAGNELARSFGTQDVLDAGSTSAFDPFLNYNFTAEGDYQIRVGTYRHYLNFSFIDGDLGVQPGLSYRLNVSLQRHDVNTAAIELVGAQVKITQGAGAGQSANITGYDPERKLFTIDKTWSGANETSIIEIGKTIAPPTVGDSYDLVLAAQPDDDVIVDVVPQVTRTYDSSLAFDASANFGQREAVQVMTATPLAKIELKGTPANGEKWAVKLNGKEFFVTVGQNGVLANLPSIAAALEAKIQNQTDAGNTYQAHASGAFLTINTTANNQRFYAEVAVSTAGGAALTGRAVITPQVKFTTLDWSTPQQVDVKALDDDVIDGGDALVFPAITERVNRIRGPLIIDGGIQITEDQFLTNPFMLPGETNTPVPDGNIEQAGTSGGKAFLDDVQATHVDPAVGAGIAGFEPRINDNDYTFRILDGVAKGVVLEAESVSGSRVVFKTDWPIDPVTGLQLKPGVGDHYYFAPVNPNVKVVEEQQVDVLNVFNTESPSDDRGTLTDTHLSGLGMGPDTVIGGRSFDGGITYHNIEALNLKLGSGSDTLTIESTHAGTTTVDAGAGNDTINVRTLLGRTLIDAGAGDDTINVGSSDQLLDQIMALLTVVGGADTGTGDVLNVTDAGDWKDESAILTGDALTGLGMPLVPEVQELNVRAASGHYSLVVQDTADRLVGSTSGLASTAAIQRLADHAVLTLDVGISDTDLRLRLEELFGLDSGAPEIQRISVARADDIYTITFSGAAAGQRFAPLAWDGNATDLVAKPDTSVDIGARVLRDGTPTPDRDTVQIVTVDASAVSFRLTVLGQQTAAIAYGASAAQVVAALQPIVDPNNADSAKPHTRNVAVTKLDDRYYVTFQGERGDARIESIATQGPAGSATVVTPGEAVQVLTVTGDSGTFQLQVLQRQANGTDLLVTTGPIALGATADEVLAALSPITDPTNTDPQNPLTHNVIVTQQGGSYAFVFQGDDPRRRIEAVLTQDLVKGEARLARPSYGISYYGFEALNVELGHGNDTFNVQATSIATHVSGNDGDDVVNVSSDAGRATFLTTHPFNAGNLDAVQATLTVDAGAGLNTLNVSDHGATAGDTDVHVQNDRITGLAPADIVYTATGGRFGGGVNVWAGAGADTISVDSTLPLDVTSVHAGAGDDQVTLQALTAGTDGFVAVFGEDGADTIDATRTAMSVALFGDAGELDFGSPDQSNSTLVAARSIDFGTGGADTINTAAGDMVIVGGFGDDTINAGIDPLTGQPLLDGNGQPVEGIRVVIGDNGQVDYNGGNVVGYQTVDTDPATGGADAINLGAGINTAFGGMGGDTINAVPGTDYIFGDNGLAVLDPVTVLLARIESTELAQGGDDTINVGAGNMIIIAGGGMDTVNAGVDPVTGLQVGPDSDHSIVGDNGRIDYNAAGRVISYQSTDTTPAAGWTDTIRTGDGNNVILGGMGGDDITTGNGTDTILGDNGIVTLDATGAFYATIATTQPGTGGDDIITALDGDKTVLGGDGFDTITLGVGRNVAIGDNGQVDYNAGGLPVLFQTTDTSDGTGDTDLITTGAGDNVIFGGVGSDIINVAEGDSVVFGDNGSAELDSTGTLFVQIKSTETDLGGDDTINVGVGDMIVVAGSGSDTVNAGVDPLTGLPLGQPSDFTIIGDNGQIDYNAAGILVSYQTTDPTPVAGMTYDDTITTGDGNQTVLGGGGGDTINTGVGDDVVLGDTGIVRLDDTGTNYVEISATPSGVGGDDTIDTHDGVGIVLGGAGGDTVTVHDENDVVFGDNGTILFDDGIMTTLTSTDTKPETGGDDVIDMGEGVDLAVGGVGDDIVTTTGNAGDVVVGDNATVTTDAAGFVQTVTTGAPALGGNDTITTGGGNDFVLGGAANDNVFTNAGNDVLIGDGGTVVFAGPALFIESKDPQVGGDDLLEADGGNDIVIGGFGSDRMQGNLTEDLLFGGNAAVSLLNGHVTSIVSDTIDLITSAMFEEFNAKTPEPAGPSLGDVPLPQVAPPPAANNPATFAAVRLAPEQRDTRNETHSGTSESGAPPVEQQQDVPTQDVPYGALPAETAVARAPAPAVGELDTLAQGVQPDAQEMPRPGANAVPLRNDDTAEAGLAAALGVAAARVARGNGAGRGAFGFDARSGRFVALENTRRRATLDRAAFEAPTADAAAPVSSAAFDAVTENWLDGAFGAEDGVVVRGYGETEAAAPAPAQPQIDWDHPRPRGAK